MLQSGYDVNTLFQEAQTRWLKPAEVMFILKNHENYQLTQEPPQRPISGSLFLFNKRVTRFFRKDGHSWRKKRDGRTVGEAHERLKVGNVEALNCYYAHGEQNPNFQRRSYWMLDPASEHIVLVHYRDVNEGKPSPGSVAQLQPGSSSSLIPSPSSCTTQNQVSTSGTSELNESCQNIASPESVEVSSNTVIKDNKTDGTADFPDSNKHEVNQFLRRLEEQLSLNEDSVEEIGPLYSQEGGMSDSEFLNYEKQISKPDQPANSFPGLGTQLQTNYHVLQQDAGYSGSYQPYSHDYVDGEEKDSLSWKEVLDSCKTMSGVDFQDWHQENPEAERLENSHWPKFNGADVGNLPLFLPQEAENFKIPPYSSKATIETNSDYFAMLYDQGQACLTVGQQQKFKIRQVSPEWGYATEVTKVIIVGSFLCNPSESTWTCMFGDTEVPVDIIQEGVIQCEAPFHVPGKVTLCITSGNRESCSEIREFEYRAKASICSHCDSSKTEASKSPEELLLLVRFVQMLLCNSSLQKGDSIETGIHLPREMKMDNDLWGGIMETLLDGSGTPSGTVDWLLQQLLKDKFQQWLFSKSQGSHDKTFCSLSKNEQGIIHMVAGLGFEWALSPILNHGVSVNFRDINGWTALHWAARFGREKMVAALLASGASAVAVTDPCSQDPIGKTPASIAATSGHKGLAGYLSEVSLTSHLSSLTLEESELSKGSAEVEAERAVDSISRRSFTAGEDQVLAAVRNAAHAAARIQSAFRAHSFRKRQLREAAASASSVDEYGISAGDIQGLSAMTKLAFRNPHEYNSAALSIQKKYRGWKGRKDFLALRQKVVTIQALVRGYQVRKHYKVICWAVGILDKIVLRWRRRGVGLRGFRSETESNDDTEDEDILKVFRKQKVDLAIEEAVSRVVLMVDSPEAREQYHRMLQCYRQAKAELGVTGEVAASTSLPVSDMEDDIMHHFQ